MLLMMGEVLYFSSGKLGHLSFLARFLSDSSDYSTKALFIFFDIKHIFNIEGRYFLHPATQLKKRRKKSCHSGQLLAATASKPQISSLKATRLKIE
jgi:hypothetical protein